MGAGASTLLTKAFKAEAAVPRRRIVKFGSSDDFVVVGAAAVDMVFGVSVADLDVVAGEPCDVHLSGVAEVDYGGNVARGALLMSDATGRAVTAAAAAGSNVRIIGVAMVAGVLGDVGVVSIGPAAFQG